MYNRVGPSELALRQQETMAAINVQNTYGRRPQTQENVGSRGGRRNQNYRNTLTNNMQMRKLVKDQQQINSDNGRSSSMGQENKSTQGGSNFYQQGILSQAMIPQDGQIILSQRETTAKSASRYVGTTKRRATAAMGDAASRIKQYRNRQKQKAQSGLMSTMQLQEKLSLLSYHPPDAHIDGRIRCSTRNQTTRGGKRRIKPAYLGSYCPADDDDFLSSIDGGSATEHQKNSQQYKQRAILNHSRYNKGYHTVSNRQRPSRKDSSHKGSQGASTQNRDTAEMVGSYDQQYTIQFPNQQLQTVDHQYDSLCISTGEKDLQSKVPISSMMNNQAVNRSLVSSEQDQIVAQGTNIEDHPLASNESAFNIPVTSRNLEGSLMEEKKSKVQQTNTTPRGPSLRQARGSDKKTGSVFFVDKSTHVQTIIKQDTIHSSGSDNATYDGDEINAPLTQRDRDVGYFDSLQSRGPYNETTNQFGSIAVSEAIGEVMTSRKKSSLSRSPIRQRTRKAANQTPSEDGLRFIGQHIHSMQETFNKKAEKLYRGKVLIDRERTRDILAARIRAQGGSLAASKKSSTSPKPQHRFRSMQQNKAIKSQIAATAAATTDQSTMNQQKQTQADMDKSLLSTARNNSNEPFAITSRHKDTQVDSEFQMTNDELLGSSNSQTQVIQTANMTNGVCYTNSVDQHSISFQVTTDRTNLQQQQQQQHFIKCDENQPNNQRQRRRKSTVKNHIFMVHSPQELQQVNLIIGADAKSENQKRVQRYMGEMEKRAHQVQADKLEKSSSMRKKAAKQTIVDIFAIVYNRLKEANKEAWAARTIQRWWKKQAVNLKQQQYLKWLPIDIDPDNCNFTDVDRVLKVLDDYALNKLGVIENEPNLPQIVLIQRAVKIFLIRTRLTRCVRDCIKFIKAMKAMQRLADRAPQKNFFYKYELIYGEEIEKELRIKAKKQDRELRIAAGQPISDTSSQKEKKKHEKEALVKLIRKQSLHRKPGKMAAYSKRAMSFNADPSMDSTNTLSSDARGQSSPTSKVKQKKSAPFGKLIRKHPTRQASMFVASHQDISPIKVLNEVPMQTIPSVKSTKKQVVQSGFTMLKIPDELDDQGSQESMAKKKIIQPSSPKTKIQNSPKAQLLSKSQHNDRNKQQRGTTIRMPLQKPHQSAMMAAAPIKSHSKRLHYHSRQDGPGSPINFGGHQVASNETLHRGGVGLVSSSFKSIAQVGVGSVRVSASQNTASQRTGLTQRTVKHNIPRDCMFEWEPLLNPEWKLKGKNKWRPDEKAERLKIMKLIAKHGPDYKIESEEGLSKKKMRQIRRKQFYAFFEGFFEKYQNDSLKLRTANLSFEEDEKVKLLSKYFKRYFNEKVDVNKTDEEEQVIKENHHGLDEGTNSRTFQFDDSLNYIAENHKDAFLGKSKGILGSYGNQLKEDFIQEALTDRKTRKMRPAKVLIQTQFAPGKPNPQIEMLDAGKRSQRSIHRIDESALSHRLSHIPKGRADTVLTTSAEGSHLAELNAAVSAGAGANQEVAIGNIIQIINMRQKGSFNSGKSVDSQNWREAGNIVSRKQSSISQNSFRSPNRIPPSCSGRKQSQLVCQSQKVQGVSSQQQPPEVKQESFFDRQRVEQTAIVRQGNPQSFNAPELGMNSYQNKLEEYRVNNLQIKAQNAKITDDFSVGYPEYQTILEKYTPSRIFAGRYQENGGSSHINSRQTERLTHKTTTSQLQDNSFSSAADDGADNFNTWRIKGQKLINMSTL